MASPPLPSTTWKGTFEASEVTSEYRLPMNLLIEKTVFVGFAMACLRATMPTCLSPESANATTDGVVRDPSEFVITTGSPPSRTATQEFVVPRSMPMTFPTSFPLFR